MIKDSRVWGGCRDPQLYIQFQLAAAMVLLWRPNFVDVVMPMVSIGGGNGVTVETQFRRCGNANGSKCESCTDFPVVTLIAWQHSRANMGEHITYGLSIPTSTVVRSIEKMIKDSDTMSRMTRRLGHSGGTASVPLDKNAVCGGERIQHPYLTDGNFLPPGVPPPRQETQPQGDSDWAPFDDRVQFELADFLFRDAALSASKVDTLLDLWTRSISEFDAPGPMKNHGELLVLLPARARFF
ncbi:hypothetical protein V8E52_003239 [Russula decolorans]